MNKIRVNFSIKDLENLSGIKAHTIRIWEKRYNLLEPNRTDTNIRTYNTASLQKLLNIAYLNNNGFKVSKIADLNEDEIAIKVKEIVAESNKDSFAINAFKMAMINFDQSLFDKTYNNLLKEQSFEEVFYSVFLPLLNEIGLLWQTNTITPVHEHFISVLIKQKLLLSTEKLGDFENASDSRTFVLFLPDNEIHDIGLLFINYLLKSKGYQTIFLGPSVPTANLYELYEFFDNITFISYFTIFPEEDLIETYIKDFNELLLIENKSYLYLLGNKTINLNHSQLPEKVKVYQSIKNLVKEM
ncbi:MerR family transcriptional regulator [Aestuariibaculum suncheonense]|uniref:MerR family transcriptional regulator n=1 Tax=Aestuariibaculum suncheonense TaxID=1028745 RepID=A0A8J6Q5X2_9FLAO|nr:MerR family transcriptional regulator [Aestuariibaculum suncheonense]MBD0834937.1 MerR family transcriptional regulator [Aestuariibaculum suncheonense]